MLKERLVESLFDVLVEGIVVPLAAELPVREEPEPSRHTDTLEKPRWKQSKSRQSTGLTAPDRLPRGRARGRGCRRLSADPTDALCTV